MYLKLCDKFCKDGEEFRAVDAFWVLPKVLYGLVKLGTGAGLQAEQTLDLI